MTTRGNGPSLDPEVPVDNCRGDYRWVEAHDAEAADFVVEFHRNVNAEVARFGPGLGGRWWVLLGPREPTPPHDHGVGFGYRADPDHPARCRSPRCWGRVVLSCRGEIVRLEDGVVTS